MNSILRRFLLPALVSVTMGFLGAVPSIAGAAMPYAWKNVAIGGGGYVLDVYCHPKQRDLVYIRTDVGGFYRWDARGQRWIPIANQFRQDQSNYYGGEGLALDPKNPNVVYIAAGKSLWAAPGSIFKSGDQGRTWKKLPLDLKMGGNEDHRWGGQRLAVSPFHSSVLLFGSRQDGLWRSGDAGASWAKVSVFPGTLKSGIGITSIAFAAQRPGAVYAAAYGDGTYESGDDGLTWRRTPGGPAEVERLAAASDGALYATHAHGIGKYDAGKWIDVTPGKADGQFGGLSIDPRDPRDVLAAMQTSHLRLFRSRDGGATWSEQKYRVRNSPPWYSVSMKQIQYVAGLTFDPCVAGRVWLTDWYAAYETDDINADLITFASHEQGHEELVVFTVTAPPTGFPLLSGVADVDGFAHRSLDDFPAHGFGDYYGGKGPTFGDTDQIVWCPGAPDHLARVGVKRWDNTGDGMLSSDGGKSWTAFPAWDQKIMPGRIAVSATDPNSMVVLRIGPGPALMTRDGGASWQNVRGLPEGLVPSVWYWQVPLAGDGALAGVFYAYQNGSLYRSTDGGAAFASAGSGLLRGGQAQLQTVPGKAGDLWLALGEGGLYHSRDGGKTVRAVPSVKRASLLALGKRAPDGSYVTLYLYGALTDGRAGIFRSRDQGLSWEEIDDPRLPIGDEPNCMAASFKTFGLVFIGTNGHGIYYGTPRLSFSLETRRREREQNKGKNRYSL